MGPCGGSGRNGDRAREARGARAAGKGGVEQEEGYRRAAREDASVPLSTCSRACLSRALSCSRSSFSPPLSRSLPSPSLLFSLPLLVSLARARGRTFRLSRRVCLSLFLPPPSFSHPLSLSFSLPLSRSGNRPRQARSCAPYSLFVSLSSLPPLPPFINSLAAISPAVLVAQERVEPIMSPRAPWLELFDPIPAAGVPRRTAVS